MGLPIRISSFSMPSPLIAASSGGFFAAEDLDVTIEKATGSVGQFEKLIAGDLDFIHTAADNVMKSVQAGGGEVCVIATLQLGLAMNLVVGPGIQTWEDLRGTVVGVDAADSGYAVVLYDLLGRHGLPPGSYGILPGGDTERRAAALVEQKTSACMLAHQPLRQALDNGARVLAYGQEVYPWYPGLTIATTRRMIAEQPDLIQRYVRAMMRACRWAVGTDEAAEVIGLIATARSLDLAAAMEILDLERAAATVDIPDVETLASSLLQCARLRAAMGGRLPDGYSDLTFYRVAHAELFSDLDPLGRQV